MNGMNRKFLQTAHFAYSCPEFSLKMGPKPIFVGEADTREFPCEEGVAR